ncbi:serpin-ZX-like [Cucumis melo var. makuwa]|uniref:Serpin-ZX-like n=1 Tax=Cucumis melo var. makuwa TaxID=1194695 RepID=A0A5A7VIH9_CUCMM|nr:serpin-ZX-like [Cucumis melo var. makuwa]
MEDMRQAIRNQGDVALAFTKRILLQENEEADNSNVVVSPLSIHLVLSLVAAGSSGFFLDQLLSFLKFSSLHQLNQFAAQIASIVLADGSSSGGPRLAFPNGVWVEQSLPLKHSFEHLVHNVYKANLCPVDFRTKFNEVTSEVNSWAERHTNGLITDILPNGSVTRLTRLILANALYFKGSWKQKFKPSETQNQEFHLLNGTTIEVPFMSSQEEQYIAAFDGFKVLALPYQQGFDQRHFSMYFFLPDAKDGLPSLIQKLNSQSGFIDNHIPYNRVRVGKFKVPKFKFSFELEVSDTLKGFGLTVPLAGLSEMLECEKTSGELYVKDIFHKSFVEVNEEGTEAAAVTVVVAEIQCLRLPSKSIMDFVADHPFLFAIREDRTGTLLFVGQMVNPLN